MFSEGGLSKLLAAADDLSGSVYYFYQDSSTSEKAAIKRVVRDIEVWKNWWVGSEEAATIMGDYNAWASNPANRLNIPSWVLPYHWVFKTKFRTYGSRLKRLNEVAALLKQFRGYFEWGMGLLGTDIPAYQTLYAQFVNYNPAEPEKPGVQKSLEEAWGKFSPILKWGAIGLAVIIALSGITKKK